MNESVETLVGILEDLTDVHERLIELGNEKTGALSSTQTEMISAITNRETKCLQQLAELEKQRVLAVNRFLYQAGLAATPSFRMEQLVQMVFKAEEKKRLTDASAKLRASIDKLQELNRFNQQLLMLNLEYIQLSLDLVTGPFEEEATYHRSFQDQSFKRSSQFDTKA